MNGDKKKAAKMFDKAKQLQPDVQHGFFELGTILLRTGNLGPIVLDFYERVTKYTPDSILCLPTMQLPTF